MHETARFDAAALERLLASEERALFNVVLRWTWDREDAAEIVQEAFGRLWDVRRRVDPTRARALVYRIALNLAASRRRWRRVRSFVGLGEEQACQRADAEGDLLERERRAAVATALERLPEPLRRTLVLCECSELGYAEIAEILGTRPGTVGSRRNTALARLKAMLTEEGDDARVA